MQNRFFLLSIFSAILLLASCSKVIEIEVPETDPMLVVEGSIRNGESPMVLLSESQGYFSALDPSEGFYIGGAEVSIEVDGTTIMLDEICTNQLSDEELEFVASLLGIDIETLIQFPVCAYTSFNPALIGEEGKTYNLHVVLDEYEATASTKLNTIIPLEDAWFQIPESSTNDSLGVIMNSYTDPDTLGNAYRWSFQRINHFPDWHMNSGQIKDESYIYPAGSTWDDAIINGEYFEYAVYRYTNNLEPDTAEIGYWKSGDTVLVRMETIDHSAYDAIYSYELALSSQGNPFAPPSNVRSNIEGGLGWWIAYGASVDTVICQ
jgi:hypothetical protein